MTITKMKILVTGGLGFIGSHTVIELIKNKHEVIIDDNLINSKIEVLAKLRKVTGIKPIFYKIDVTDESIARGSLPAPQSPRQTMQKSKVYAFL